MEGQDSQIRRGRQEPGAKRDVGSAARRSARRSGAVDDLLELDERQGARSNPRVAANGKLVAREQIISRSVSSGSHGRLSSRVETHLSAQRRKGQGSAAEPSAAIMASTQAGRRANRQARGDMSRADESQAGFKPPPKKPRRAPHCSHCGLPTSEHTNPCDPRQIEKDAEREALAATERARDEAVKQKAQRVASDMQHTPEDIVARRSHASVAHDQESDGYLDGRKEEHQYDDGFTDRDIEMEDDFSVVQQPDSTPRSTPTDHPTGARRFQKHAVKGGDAPQSPPAGASRTEQIHDAGPSMQNGLDGSTPKLSNHVRSDKSATPSLSPTDGSSREISDETNAIAGARIQPATPKNSALASDEHKSATPSSKESDGEIYEDDLNDEDAGVEVTEESMRALARALANGQVLTLADVNKLRRSLERYDGSGKPPVDLFLITRDKLHSRYHVKTYTHPLAGGVKATPNGAVELPLTSTSKRKLCKTTYADRKKHRHERFNAFAQKGDALAAAEEDEVWVFAYAVPKSGAGELREWASPAVRADAPRLPALIRKTIFDHLNPHREQAVREREAKEDAWQRELLKAQSQNKAAEERNAALREQIVNMQRDNSRLQKRQERHDAKRREKRAARQTAKREELRLEEEVAVTASMKKARARAAREERRRADD